MVFRSVFCWMLQRADVCVGGGGVRGACVRGHVGAPTRLPLITAAVTHSCYCCSSSRRLRRRRARSYAQPATHPPQQRLFNLRDGGRDALKRGLRVCRHAHRAQRVAKDAQQGVGGATEEADHRALSSNGESLL